MTRYAVVTDRAEGYLLFEFSDNKYLVKYENCVFGLTDAGHRSLLEQLPNCRHEDEFKLWVTNNGHFMILLPKEDLSFEGAFYWHYDLPRNKAEAMAYWNKLPVDLRRLAKNNIVPYKMYCEENKGWYNQMFPDGFLNPKTKKFGDQWFKMLKCYTNRKK